MLLYNKIKTIIMEYFIMENKKIMLSSFITGTVLILTAGVLFKVYSWLWGYVYEFISPIQKALSNFLYIDDIFLILLSFIILVSSSFFLGFFIRLIAKNKYEDEYFFSLINQTLLFLIPFPNQRIFLHYL